MGMHRHKFQVQPGCRGRYLGDYVCLPGFRFQAGWLLPFSTRRLRNDHFGNQPIRAMCQAVAAKRTLLEVQHVRGRPDGAGEPMQREWAFERGSVICCFVDPSRRPNHDMQETLMPMRPRGTANRSRRRSDNLNTTISNADRA
ncbi:hypothetical protein VTI28DRAFT_7057 [Corynascus sepedonium]